MDVLHILVVVVLPVLGFHFHNRDIAYIVVVLIYFALFVFFFDKKDINAHNEYEHIHILALFYLVLFVIVF